MSRRINWNNYSYTEEQLREAIQNNISARASMISLGLVGSGSGYKPVLRLIKLLEIDTSHWLGKGWLRGKSHSFTPPKLLNDILKENTNVQSYRLGKRLIKEGLFEDKCSNCNISEWQGQKLSLQLDHINGIHTDNRLENVRLLCPNCHSLTPTFAGKNTKTSKPKRQKIKNFCLDCHVEISSKSLRCKVHAAKKQNQFKIIWPSNEELKERLKTISYLQLGKELGVSDNAIRKHLRGY